MSNTVKWIRGTVFAALGLTGLYLASRAESSWGVAAGILVLIIAYLLVMRCIRRNVGTHNEEGHA